MMSYMGYKLNIKYKNKLRQAYIIIYVFFFFLSKGVYIMICEHLFSKFASYIKREKANFTMKS